MMGMMKRQTSARWWSESHQTPGRSPWLQSTLAELDQKIEAMLQLIKEDADSFALRAEMYYNKRPQLISMVEDFYRAHRSLAEKYDQLKSDSGTRLVTALGTSFSSTKSRLEKSVSGVDRIYDSFSEIRDHEESAESEVDDPEQDDVNLVDQETKDEEALSEVNDEETKEEDVLSEVINEEIKDEEIISEVGLGEVMKSKEELQRLEEVDRIYDSFSEIRDHEESAESEVDDPEQGDVNLVDQETKNEEALSEVNDEETKEEDVLSEVTDEEIKDEEIISEVCLGEVMKLKEELRRLEEENRIQKDQLEQKDEEKREAIRQLSLAVDILKEENGQLRKYITRDSPKKSSPFERKSDLKETFLRKLFNSKELPYCWLSHSSSLRSVELNLQK